MPKTLQVTSEIGSLKQVLLHRPGQELANLQPTQLTELLFDDIPYLKHAQLEHDKFAALLRENGVEVTYLEDLCTEAIDAANVRNQFVDLWISECGLRDTRLVPYLKDYLLALSTKDLVLKTMAGITRAELDLPAPPTQTLRAKVAFDRAGEPDLLVEPMPNLYFTRDPFSIVGGGVCINRMYSETRRRETLYGRTIFRYHPTYAGAPQWYTPEMAYHTEGGDLLVLSDTTLAIGLSQRTEAAAIDTMAQTILWPPEKNTFERIYAITIPQARAFMHLDTVFTQVDVDAFTMHPTITGVLEVYRLERGAHKGEIHIKRMVGPFKEILAEMCGLDEVRLIPCGGGNPIAANREQWDDGSNTLCLAPGKLCVYERNHATNEALDKAGMELVCLSASELSRGRGGPRCMSMPFIRETPERTTR